MTLAQSVSRGKVANASGRAAEDSVARHYLDAGYRLDQHRWRGKSGEVDLVLQARGGGPVVFVEVKAAKTFAIAAASLQARQIERLRAAALEYVAALPMGQLTEMRFDVALVDGRAMVEILENAF